MTENNDFIIELPSSLLKKKEVVIFDIDNTLIDVSERYRKSLEEAELDPYIPVHKQSYERRKKFWDIFLSEKYIDDDKPDKENINLLETKYAEGYGIILLTGRPIKMIDITEKQLKRFGIPYDLLIMRPPNNKEPDKTLKPRIISKLLDSGLEVIEYHEDDPATLLSIKNKFRDIKLYPHNIAKKKLFFHHDK